MDYSPRTVGVVVDVIGRPGPYTYSWPQQLGEPNLGDEVTVPLRNRVVAGWVIDVDQGYAGAVKPVLKRRRVAPPDGVTRTALAASQWYSCSPVHFLRWSRRPLIRGAPEVRRQTGSGRLKREEVLFWHSVGDSSLEVAESVIASRYPGESGIAVLPTRRQADRLLARLRNAGISAADWVSSWDLVATGGIGVAVGTRTSGLAPVPAPRFVLVVDPVDPAMRDQSSPYFEGFELARLRAREEDADLVMVTAAPPLEEAVRLRVLSQSFPESARRWPKIRLLFRSDLDGDRGVPGWIAQNGRALVSAAAAIKLAVVVPDGATNASVICGSCGAVQRCTRCNSLLRPVNLGRGAYAREIERLRGALALDALYCSVEAETVKAVCMSCGSERLRVVGVSSRRAAALLEGALRREVVLCPDDGPVGGEVVVGGVGLLDRLEEVGSVVLWGLDRFFGVHSMVGSPLAIYYLNRAASLVAPRGGEVVVVLDDRAHPVAEAIATRDLSRLYRGELALRERLRLPPARALAIASGPLAGELANALVSKHPRDVEVMPGRKEGSVLIVADDELRLHRLANSVEHSVDTGMLKLEFSPRNL